jgi:hypothetical protein
MRIVFHLGVHGTDEERLVKTLLRNRGRLAEAGIAVPGPTRYRSLIRETAVQLDGRAASRETQDLVLEQILDGAALPDRLILSWDNFLAFAPWALRGALYPVAGARLRGLAQIFPDHSAEFHLALRGPASFLPALLRKLRGKSYDEMMMGLHPQDLFWSDMVHDITRSNPSVPLHLWCDEESPLIWPEVLAQVAGLPPGSAPLEGEEDLIAGLLPPEVAAQLAATLKDYAPPDLAGRAAIRADFLERHALPEALELEADLPGWSPALLAALERQYEEDLARIAASPGVHLLRP